MISLVLALSWTVVVGSSGAEVMFSGSVRRTDDSCDYDCNNAIFPSHNGEVDSDRKYVTSCCLRGCRFFNLADVSLKTSNFNNSLEACDSACKEAYTVYQSLFACIIGCATTAKRSGVKTIFRFDIRVEDGAKSDWLLISPDAPESEIFNDPGLGKELIKGWWDLTGFKLPQTYLKSIPVDSEQTIDYDGPLEITKEIEKTKSNIPGSDWLRCASKHTGIPQWLLGCLIVITVVSAIWLCLSSDKPSDPQPNDKINLIDSDMNGKVMVYLPPEPFLLGNPPPKYNEVFNSNDIILKV